MFGKSKVAALVAEFLGAGTLTAAVYTIAARTSFPLFSGLAAGATVALFTMIMGAVSGAQLNPAITFGMWTLRKIQTSRAVAYIFAQMIGGVAMWKLLQYFLGHKLTSIAGTSFDWKVFTAEAIGTALFAFGFAAAALTETELSKKAAIVGASLLVGVLFASLASNGVLNPAVAVGIQSWSWTYAAAPFAGALVGMNLYGMLFAAESTSLVKMSASAPKATTRKKVVAKKKAPAKRKK
jgi:aquaporin Z